ncbi:MAG: hypothetical protein AAFQ82_03540 [Myxococcota bacterium]
MKRLPSTRDLKSRIRDLWWLLAALTLAGCAGRNYTYYLVRPTPKKSAALKGEEELAQPLRYGSTSTMKVRWNDGDTVTEIDVPVLEGGQRIVIEHGALDSESSTIPAASSFTGRPRLR